LIGVYCARALNLPIASDLREKLINLVSRMRALQFPEDVDEFIDPDTAFHRSVVIAFRQRHTLRVWTALSSQLGVLVALTLRFLSASGEWTAERHQVLVEALCQPDTEVAAQAMASHYRSLEEQIGEASTYAMRIEPDR
jgi:DNA-binding GntR family transcriptional regulator